MTYDEWVDRYQPVTNHIEPNAPFDDGNGGMMYETYGAELQHIISLVAKGHGDRVWTWVSSDGSEAIISGYHMVNRMGYFVATVPHPTDTVSEVTIFDTSEVTA